MKKTLLAKKKTQTAREPKKNKVEPTPWILPDGFDAQEYEGFVYRIEHKQTGQYYYGKKFFWARHRVKQEGKTRRKHVTKESDWRHYRSSSKELQEFIKKDGLDSFNFQMIHLCKTRTECNYLELKEQITHDVLNDPLSFNYNILQRFYKKRC